jgi:hypothetical protein
VHWVLFEPTISGFYDIGSFGMGIGGVLDRPTDTLPHGVYGVDYSCGPIILHVQAHGAIRYISKRSLMSIFQGNVDIISMRVHFELEEGARGITNGSEEDCIISFTFMVTIYPVQTMHNMSVDSELGSQRCSTPGMGVG